MARVMMASSSSSTSTSGGGGGSSPRVPAMIGGGSRSFCGTVLSLPVLMGFLLGCFLSSSLLLSFHTMELTANVGGGPPYHSGVGGVGGIMPTMLHVSPSGGKGGQGGNDNDNVYDHDHDHDDKAGMGQGSSSSSSSILDGMKILVVIASFDFGQLPLLEEVLDSYGDLCEGGAYVDVVIHTTMPYPVTLIDVLNSRLVCSNPSERSHFHVTISLQNPVLRLHLVDLHRAVFYDRIDDYDLFVYTEDDIRVTPRTVAAYWTETRAVERIVGRDDASNYNVGIVRYEYNYPSNVVIDDKTRHATQNVTRVYWEHSSHADDPFPESIDVVPQPALRDRYVHMKNHHQGMYLATRSLLRSWKDRPNCRFHIVTDRPGRGPQPTEGTQRVWMSSQQLYGSRHCNVQQLIPMSRFGSFTCWHLPNKNYRRVGRYRNRTFSDGTEVFETPRALLTSMKLHLDMRRRYPIPPSSSTSSSSSSSSSSKTTSQQSSSQPTHYDGPVSMKDDIDRSMGWNRELDRKIGSKQDYYNMVDRRMEDYRAYEARGGILSEEDMDKIELVSL